jgi:molybdate transport system substrate-binding protein
MTVRRTIYVALLVALSALCSVGQELRVAAAADLQFAFQDVTAGYQKETGNQVQVVFGSSGNFFAQIENGAPFDLFFSADMDYSKKLEADGLAEPGTLYEYAAGKIVLWSLKDFPVDVTRGLEVLKDPGVKKIAIANPEHAPYGRAAVAALKQAGIYQQIAGKLVLGENISQTMSFVVSGSADTGIVALSLALAPSMTGKGKYFEIPAEEYPPIRQGAVVLKSSKQKKAAEQFLEYLKSPQIAALMNRYGFSGGGSGNASAK